MYYKVLASIAEGEYKNFLIDSYDEKEKILNLINNLTGEKIQKSIDDIKGEKVQVTCLSHYPTLYHLEVVNFDSKEYDEGDGYIKYTLQHNLGTVKACFSDRHGPSLFFSLLITGDNKKYIMSDCTNNIFIALDFMIENEIRNLINYAVTCPEIFENSDLEKIFDKYIQEGCNYLYDSVVGVINEYKLDIKI